MGIFFKKMRQKSVRQTSGMRQGGQLRTESSQKQTKRTKEKSCFKTDKLTINQPGWWNNCTTRART